METASDSRKRPLDSESESGISKKSLQRMDCTGTENIYLKVLVPSVAAGAIIGKGGETITQIQKDTGANIKMSKSNDYYPGTTERVCLITGSPDAVRTVHNFVMEKIRDKPDQGSRNESSDGSRHTERHKQVKILVPNSTAGMIIGKAGNYISQIKEDSNAYVQISQKSKEMNLPERCVTVAGDLSQVKKAVDLILQKIIDDPQSGSCPNISYADYRGPVASANPTGSPYATSHQGPSASGPTPSHVSPFQNLGTGINNLTLSSGNNSLFDTMKTALRNAGYGEVAVEEISNAMLTLLNYGFFGMAMQQLMTHVTTLQAGGVPPPLMAPNPGPHNTGTMPGIIGQGPNPAAAAAVAAAAATYPGTAPNAANATTGDGHSFFGPMGATTTSSMTSDTPADYVHERPTYGAAPAGATVTQAGAAAASAGDAMFIGQNQNSFGLGMSIAGNATGTEEEDKKELEVGEHIVGAILGPGGRGIVDIQQQTCTNIQISKKGVYAPGTRNRIVTITGTASNVQRAQTIIEHRIGVEEEKRARTSR